MKGGPNAFMSAANSGVVKLYAPKLVVGIVIIFIGCFIHNATAQLPLGLGIPLLGGAPGGIGGIGGIGGGGGTGEMVGGAIDLFGGLIDAVVGAVNTVQSGSTQNPGIAKTLHSLADPLIASSQPQGPPGAPKINPLTGLPEQPTLANNQLPPGAPQLPGNLPTAPTANNALPSPAIQPVFEDEDGIVVVDNGNTNTNNNNLPPAPPAPPTAFNGQPTPPFNNAQSPPTPPSPFNTNRAVGTFSFRGIQYVPFQ